MTDYKIIIPARYNSKRFPGKPLVKIHGKTMLERVWLNAMDSAASEVIIATDDHRIEAVAKNFGAHVCVTSNEHKSGTDRIIEAIEILGLRDDEISVFSSTESDRIIEQFNQAPPLQKAQIINDVVAQYPGIGEHIVMRSFYKAGMDAGQNLTAFLASSPLSSVIAGDLQQALITDEKELNQFITGDAKEQVAQALIIAMKPFNDSILGIDSPVGLEFANRTAMTGSGDQANQRDGFVGEINQAAMKLAKYYIATKGKTPQEAAQMASRIHTSRFVYSEVNGQPLRLEKNLFNQTEADAIASGLSSWVQESLNVGSIMLEDGDEQATRIVIEDLKRGGAAWITSPDNKSAYLVNQRLGFVPVLNPDGSRITINFSSLPTKIGEIAPPVMGEGGDEAA